MVEQVNGIYRPTRPVAAPETTARPSARPLSPAAPNFAEVLESQIGGPVRFSAHAQDRLRKREIQFTPQDEQQLSEAVDMANAKGAKESLILMDDLALVVSIRNRVVITALDQNAQGSNVFTNIDSAVVLHRSK